MGGSGPAPLKVTSASTVCRGFNVELEEQHLPDTSVCGGPTLTSSPGETVVTLPSTPKKVQTPGLVLAEMMWEMLSELSVLKSVITNAIRFLYGDWKWSLARCYAGVCKYLIDCERCDVPISKREQSFGMVSVYDGGFGPAP